MTPATLSSEKQYHLKKLQRLGRLADELLDEKTSDLVMLAIGAKLARLGIIVASGGATGTVH